MGSGQSKPKNKTGKVTVLQKIERASKTGVLSLRDHGLQELPKDIFKLQNLTTLDLSNNKLKKIPSDISTLTNLKSLNCDGNQIQNGGLAAIKNLPNLQNLSAGKNFLGKPIVIKDPKQKKQQPSSQVITFPSLPSGLKQLKLDDNHFTSLPEEILSSKLTKLTKLDVSSNLLAVVPPEIANLVSLAELNLDGNSIVSLPEQIGSLKKLKALSLKQNQIQVSSTLFTHVNPQPLPECLFTDTPLIDLNLHGNKMTNTQLNEFKGFDSFLDRRQAVKSKNIYGGALTDLGVCGLE